MGVATLVLAGVLIGGALSAPTSKATQPELLLQPPIHNAAPVTYISRHYAQDELGQVNYGFSHPGQAKNELRDSSGNVAGSYSYIDADNKVVVVEYTAGESGFQVTSNNLPIAASDTPEVLAAKLQFVEQYNAAAIAAANAANDAESDDNVKSPVFDSSSTNIAIPVQVSPSPVKDTPEVIAAKLRFVEAYNAAALAAADAPDDNAAATKHTNYRSEGSVNPNPIKDTPEVIAAKLQFVEAYNAAALAAVKQEGNPQADSSSNVAIVYGIPVVQDTPEVLAAKLKFVAEYNAAAKAAALAPDNDVDVTVTKEDPSVPEDPSEEPTTELGILAKLTLGTTISPREDEETTEFTTTLPFPSEKSKETNKKVYSLTPIKVEISPEEKSKDSQSDYVAVEQSKAATDPLLYKLTYSNPGVYNPQAYSYGVGVAQEPAEAPGAKTSMLPKPVFHPLLDEQAITVPVTYINRHHAQDELGQFNYGYSYPGQAQNELRYANGHIAGVYSYVDDENKLIHVEYTAGKDGFQVASNNLPIAIQDTPEVLAAKLQFVEAYNAAALAAANAPDDPAEYSSPDEDNISVFLANQNQVKDTTEVLAAKLQFVEAYNAAALAAVNAPDDPVESILPVEDNVEATITNPNPISDTPEVTAAKIQFVEAYNAATLAAAGAAKEPGQEENSKATLAYAFHPVKDTPEVIAAKIKFVEAYNAAAMAAALASDDEPQENQEEIGEVETYAVDEIVPVMEDSSVVLPPVPSTSLQVPAVAFAAPVIYVSRHHAQDELGQVNYGFSHPNEAKNEVRDADGNVSGAYSYVDSEKKVISVKYTAGKDGFQVVSNNLPVAPNDTPEVLAAKLHFVEAYNAAALAAAAAPDDPEIESSYISDASFVVPTPVHDTPEVLAAKLQFVEAYNAAALAAANAPDDPSEEYTTNKKSVNTDVVEDKTEVTQAKLNFVESYNEATIAAASAGDNAELAANVIYSPHPVQDTPEVIAAKIAFVEAYNAAALAAAAAPDDPIDAEASTFLEESNSDEPTIDMALETNNLQKLAASDLPEVSQPLNDLDTTSQITENNEAITSPEFHAFPGAFTRYAGYLPRGDGTVPAMYTYSVPYGLYGTLKSLPIPVHFAPTQLIQQDLYQNNNHIIMYAPLHGY